MKRSAQNMTGTKAEYGVGCRAGDPEQSPALRGPVPPVEVPFPVIEAVFQGG